MFLNNSNELVGVALVGGVSGRPQPVSPLFVIGGIQFKQLRVARPRGQKLGMVSVLRQWVSVLSETLTSGVVIVRDAFALPAVMALDAKVIIGFFDELTAPRIGFKDTLSQGDARRNPVELHLFHRWFSKSRYVVFLVSKALVVFGRPRL